MQATGPDAQSSIGLLARTAAAGRVSVLLLGFAISCFFQRFDKSTMLALSPSPFNFLLSWDANFFLHITREGYSTEHTLPFFPLLPLLIRTIPLLDPMTSAVIANSVLFGISALLLYKISLLRYSQPVSLLASLFFIFNPAGIVYSSFYSESLFCCLFLLGLYYYVSGRLLRAATFFGLCSLTRANAVLFVLFFTPPFWAVVLGPFGVYQLYCLLRICRQRVSFYPFVPYSYIQKAYWEQGFLKFFTANNIPNLVCGFIPIANSLALIYLYIEAKLHAASSALSAADNKDEKDKKDEKEKKEKKEKKDKKDKKESADNEEREKTKIATGRSLEKFIAMPVLRMARLASGLSMARVRGFLRDPLFTARTNFVSKLFIILGIQTFSLIFMIHWNIAYRFLSYNPVLYWAMAFCTVRFGQETWFKLLLTIHFVYGLMYTMLFCAFYPPA